MPFKNPFEFNEEDLINVFEESTGIYWSKSLICDNIWDRLNYTYNIPNADIYVSYEAGIFKYEGKKLYKIEYSHEGRNQWGIYKLHTFNCNNLKSEYMGYELADMLYEFKYNIKEDLSKEQQEYFKNSKVRDNNGNLLVVYHGTKTPGFKEFNPQGSNSSQFGKYKFGKYNVNYFSSDKNVARGYTDLGVEDNDNIYACYINIENPYIVDNKSTADLKTAFNIKDDTIRKKQIDTFNKVFNKWKGKCISYDEERFKQLNKDLAALNVELRPTDTYADDVDEENIELFDLYHLGNNSFFGAEGCLEYQYYTDELFDDDMYEQLRDDIIGDYENYYDDYFFDIDSIVRYVLLMNEEDGKNYDGIIIKDIRDVGPKGDLFGDNGIDFVTLKSSSQIKLINNTRPTNSTKIDEENIISKFIKESMILDEAKRSDLINKSKNAQNYKDQSKGKNRYERRTKSSIATSVSQYNKIDMDALFKRDILTVGIQVNGETDKYVVTMRFVGVLKEVQKEVQSNKGKLEFKVIARAMSRVFNNSDVSINCTCPDAKYRMNYWQNKNGYGTMYEPRPSNVTNPNDTKGAGCKHTLLVLNNLDWMMKVASVINNYIKYCQYNLQRNYAYYIFPKIYGMKYDKAIQLQLFDTGLLPSDQALLTNVATSTFGSRDAKGRFIKGNEYRFQKQKEIETDDNQVAGQYKFELSDNEKELKLPDEMKPKPTKFSMDDYDDNGNLVGNGEEIKPKRSYNRKNPLVGKKIQPIPKSEVEDRTLFDLDDEDEK